MRAVDTNVVLRLLVGDDHRQAVVAEHFVADGAWISTVVLLEAARTLESVYRRGDADIAAAVDMLLNHPLITIQSSDALTEALQLYRQDPALGFADCLILASARSAGHLPLGTFDRRLGKLEGAQTLR